jgi:soluble lytic murein transglycosylase-like protein
MTKDQLIAIAVAAATRYSLAPSIVCAMVERESTWNPWKIRYEPAFFNKYVLPAYSSNKFDITEAKARSISWGLMQVMGEDAREFGLIGEIPMLCDPNIGLDYGCKIFAHKLKVQSGNVPNALLAWNGGSNPKYPGEVLALEPHYLPPGDKSISA